MEYAIDIRVLAIVLSGVLLLQMLALACWLVARRFSRAFATTRRAREAREPEAAPVQAGTML